MHAVCFLCFLMETVWQTKDQREARIPSLVVAPLHCIGHRCYAREEGEEGFAGCVSAQ